MRRPFIEPNVPFQENFLEIYEELTKYYSEIVVTINNRNDLKEATKKLRELKNISYRYHIVPTCISDTKVLLRKIRFKVDLISIFPNSKNLAAFSARDRRIDILVFDSTNFNLFTTSIAKLAKENEKILEINFGDIIRTPHGTAKVSKLGRYRALSQRAIEENVKLIFTMSPVSKYDIKSPRELEALGELLDIPPKIIIDGISKIIKERIELNRRKRSGEYILPDVRIIKKED